MYGTCDAVGLVWRHLKRKVAEDLDNSAILKRGQTRGQLFTGIEDTSRRERQNRLSAQIRKHQRVNDQNYVTLKVKPII